MNKRKVDGYFKYFNKDGSLDYSEEWVDGYLKEKKQYKNNKLNGISESYYPKMGYGSKNLFHSIKTYKDDILHGAYEVRQSNGLLWERQNFANGKVNGVSETFHDTGELWIKDTYQEGELLLREEYYPNGQIMFDKSKDEITIKYHDNGIIASKGKYAYVPGPRKQARSKKDGEWKYYFNNGKIRSKGNYKVSKYNHSKWPQSKKNGEWEYYKYDGSFLRIEQWKDGNPISDGIILRYHDNGQLKWKCTFKDGKKYGELPYEEFYEDGQLREKVYQRGNIFSKEIFHPDGKLFEAGQFKDGIMVGVWKEYHENVKVIWKGKYDSSGSRRGQTWKVYDYENKHIEDLYFNEFGDTKIVKKY